MLSCRLFLPSEVEPKGLMLGGYALSSRERIALSGKARWMAGDGCLKTQAYLSTRVRERGLHTTRRSS